MFNTIQANRQLSNTITRGTQLPVRPVAVQSSFFAVLLKALSTFSA
jgi:hypothetical protein